MRALSAVVLCCGSTVLVSIAVRVYEKYTTHYATRVVAISPMAMTLWCIIAGLAVLGVYWQCFALAFGTWNVRQEWRSAVRLGLFGIVALLTVLLPELMAPAASGQFADVWIPKEAGAFTAAYVFFDNGSDIPNSSDLDALNKRAQKLKGCAVPNVLIVGYASSAPYRQDSDARNLALAYRRATNVASALNSLGIHIETKKWALLKEMQESGAVFADISEKRRLRARELLNRRVDVFWPAGQCGT